MLPHVKPTIRPRVVRLIIGIKHDEISFRNIDGWIGGRVGGGWMDGWMDGRLVWWM